MKKLAFILLFLAAGLFACDPPASGDSHSGDDHTAEHADGHDHGDGHGHAEGDDHSHDDHSEAGEVHNHETEGLGLNNGAKWKINEEMMPHISAAKTVFNNYVAESGTDYKTLSAKLKEHNDNLIKSCTMQGASHDQLHVWLIPHIDLVTDLGDVDSEENANKVIAKLKTSFEKFDQHFE